MLGCLRRGTFRFPKTHKRLSTTYLKACRDFFKPFCNNINSRTKSNLLFEQSCKVHKLPKSKAPAFRVFVRQQAIAFLTAVDDWLEARVEIPKQKRTTSKLCAAGVFTFAYLDAVKKDRRSARG